MTLYYLDSSAVVKAYVPEAGSAWVRSLLATEVIVASAIMMAEVATALRRRAQEGEFSFDQGLQLYRQFLRDVRTFEIVDVSADILASAAADALKPDTVPLRALDAVHLAAARESFIIFRRSLSERCVVVTADQRLLTAARAAGLETENPEDHP